MAYVSKLRVVNMRQGYVEIAPNVGVEIATAKALPTIKKHIDGPILTWAGHIHWLSWKERFAIWAEWETAESLAQKHWPRRCGFTSNQR